VLVWWSFFHQSKIGEAQSALRNAYSEWRTHESRVTGFNYAPLDQLRDASGNPPGYAEREHAEILIRSLEREDRSPAAIHLLG
ncbi:hypothetical protein ACXWPL_09775, partial [Streptococcus pyogenes]